MAKDTKRKPKPFNVRDLRNERLKLFAENEWFKQNERLMMRALGDKGCRFLDHGDDAETRFEIVLPEPASPPSRQEKTPKRKWRLDELTPVVNEMFPGGPPKDRPTVELVWQLGNELKQRGIRGVSVTTMERALGRRR
jgi:hypothetical protein